VLQEEQRARLNRRLASCCAEPCRTVAKARDYVVGNEKELADNDKP
jgi:hypothetical protein